MNENESISSRTRILKREAVMACAATVFLAFSYTNQLVAQTLNQYATRHHVAASVASNETAQVPQGIADLKGKEINFDNYRSYVTVDRPDDDTKKFLFYNVGTGKFLSLGGYWGTHAALSNVPRPFWLQRRSDKTAAGQWAYIRYPETVGTTYKRANAYVNPLDKFLTIKTLQVGSKEGTTRTNAVYKSVTLHKAGMYDDVSTNVLKPNISAGGRAFLRTYTGNITDNFLSATIDLSTCNPDNAGSKEDLLSIGTDVSDAKTGQNIHLLYDGSKLYIETYSGGTLVDNVTIDKFSDTDTSVSGTLQLQLTADGLRLNGNTYLVSSTVLKALAAQDASATLQVGSVYGTTRSYATYKTVTFGTESNVVAPGHVGDGTRFVSTYGGNLYDYKVEAEIDLTSCDEKDVDKQNILSIGTDISKWGTSQGAYNIHLYYDKSGNTVNVDLGIDDNIYEQKVELGDSKTVTVELNDAYLLVNGNIVFTTAHDIVKNLLTTTQLQVGSAEGDNRSWATYNKLVVTKAETDRTNVLPAGTKVDGYAFARTYQGGLDGKTITAEIDLSTCKEGVMEDVLWIGEDVSQWKNAVMFRYQKPNGFIQYFTYNSEGKQSGYADTWFSGDKITITYADGKLNVCGQEKTDNAIDETTHNYLKAASSIQVGSIAGNHSHATYNKLTVEDASASANGNVLFAEAATTTPGAEQTITVYDNVDMSTMTDGDVQALDNADYANGDELSATIDLSNCDVSKIENVFSVGTNIAKWGSQEEADNIHIYYLGKDATGEKHKLYAVYVNKDHNDDFKRLFTVPVGTDMQLSLSAKGLIINDKNIFPDIDPMPEITTTEENKDYAGEIVRFKYADAKNKIYEIGEDGKYVIADPANSEGAHGIYDTFDGYVYTVENRTESRMPYFISSVYRQTADASANEGSFLSYAPRLENKGFGDVGVFGDRALPQEDMSVDDAVAASEWVFEPVAGKTNTYRLYLNMKNMDVLKRTGKDTFDQEKKSGKFYLQATAQNVFDNGLQNYYWGGYEDKEADATDGVEAICLEGTDVSTLGEKAEWKVFDMAEYKSLFNADYVQTGEGAESVMDVSFLLADPSFSRKSADLTNWKMDSSLEGHVRIGYDDFSKKKTTDTDYSDDNGGTEKSYEYYERNHDRYMGVDVNGASGKFQQTVKLSNSGWYTLKCGGITTVGSKLFVSYLDNNRVEKELHKLTEEEFAHLDLKTSDNVYWPFDWNWGRSRAMVMYNALAYMNDANLVDDTNHTDATIQKAFTEDNYVRFYIDPDVLAAKGGNIDVTFGIDVAPGDGTSTQAEDDATTTTSTTVPTNYSDLQWTVFDNFQLLFAGNISEPYLVLDEDDTTLDHLDNTVNKYVSNTDATQGKVVNKKLMLHRTFSPDKWNTIMLPVGLTEEQYKQAFGDAPLAELDKLTDYEIQFKTVVAASVYTGGGSDATAYWLKPMTPYIIKPAIKEGSTTETYTAELYTWASGGSAIMKKTIGETGPYFVVDNISMVKGVVKTAEAEGFSDYKWDFKNQYTTTIGTAAYPYVMTGNTVDGNGTMTAYGHLTKNFTTTESGTRQLIEGRAPMADSYTMSGNKLTYLGNGAASKGFRCWFQYTSPSSEAAPTLFIDGVNVPTGIAGLMDSDDGITPIGKYMNGVYSIDGQLVRRNADNGTDGLPKGIYIVNGRKVVKN